MAPIEAEIERKERKERGGMMITGNDGWKRDRIAEPVILSSSLHLRREQKDGRGKKGDRRDHDGKGNERGEENERVKKKRLRSRQRSRRA